MRTLTSTLLLALLAACSPTRRTPSPAAPSDVPPAATGVNRLVHWNGDSSASTPVSPTTVFIEAEFPGAKLDVRPAQLAEDGSFSIPGPSSAGPYWLRIDDSGLATEDLYVLTGARQVDLGRDVVGDASGFATSASTSIVVDAGGLSPWADGDEGDLTIPGVGYRSALLPLIASNGPATGDTGLSGLTYDWQERPLLDGANGSGIFTQSRRQTNTDLGLDYVTPIKSFATGPVAVSDGSSTHVTGTFEDAPADTIPLNWKATQFLAQKDQMHSGACQADLDFPTFWVSATPGHGAHGLNANGFGSDPLAIPVPAAAVIDEVNLPDLTDFNGTLAAGNPYPSDWLYARYELSFVLSCPLPEGGTPGNAEMQIGLVTAAPGGDPVVPVVGPVSGVRIAGQDLDTAPTGVGTVPSISWTAPVLGTPTSYEIHVLEVGRSGVLGGRFLSESARLIVAGDVNRITPPHGVFAEGTTYTLLVRAISRPGQDVTTAPFRAGVPVAYTDFATGYFSP